MRACFGFLPQKPLKEQEMNNNYDMWVICWVYKFSTTVMENKMLLLNWKRFT